MGPLCHSFYIAICNTVLMMRPNTREGIYLTHRSTVVFKFFGSKDTIVSVEFVVFDTFLFNKRFKATFALDGFCRII